RTDTQVRRGPLIHVVRNTSGRVRRPGRDDREAHEREDPYAREPPGGKEERERSADGIPTGIAHSTSLPISLTVSKRANKWAVRNLVGDGGWLEAADCWFG